MICLSGNPGRIRDLAFLKAHGHGRLLTAGTIPGWRTPIPGLTYGVDNGAFAAWKNDAPFPEAAFLKMLAKIPRSDAPIMVVCPDIVARGKDSLAFSRAWRARLDDLGYGWLPWYLAVQDGMDAVEISAELTTGRWAGLFVGGTMAWKRRTAEAWVELAHRHGCKAHIGRTPQLADLVWAERIGADSCDSTSWARNDRHGVLMAAKAQTRLGQGRHPIEIEP